MSVSNSIIDSLVAQAKAERRAITVNFELLPVCNLDCKMCYIRTDMETVRSCGGLIPAEEWIGLAREMLEYGSLFLLLTGGEVFLYPNFRYLYETLYDMGFLITINTNATLIDEKTVSWLVQRPPKCVSMSLYGASNETYKALCGVDGMFDRVNRAVTLLQNSGILVEAKTMLNPLNAHDVEACRDYCSEKNIPYEVATYAFPPARKPEPGTQVRFTPEEAALWQINVNRIFSDQNSFHQGIRDHLAKYEATRLHPGKSHCGLNCSASNSSCWITWQGRMTPCGMLNSPTTHPFRDGFEVSWNKLKEKSDRITPSIQCAKCDKRSICTVCPGSNCAETGHLDGCSAYHCRMTECLLEEMKTVLKTETNEVTA